VTAALSILLPDSQGSLVGDLLCLILPHLAVGVEAQRSWDGTISQGRKGKVGKAEQRIENACWAQAGTIEIDTAEVGTKRIERVGDSDRVGIGYTRGLAGVRKKDAADSRKSTEEREREGRWYGGEMKGSGSGSGSGSAGSGCVAEDVVPG
jgi:hypothetical protein